ncbi:MAG: alpha/beta-type small acid-soluble spore protein [Oscillospiraceae bacterium]
MSKKDISRKLNKLKMEAAAEIGMTQFVKENNDHYKGDLPAKINGAQGGPIGGQMVKMMLQAEQSKMSGNME